MGLRAAGDDPFVRQELVETAYHVLWELVHVFFDHRGLLEGARRGAVHDTGASSFLYPFLGEQQTDLEAVLADVRALGADEGGRGRRSCATQTLAEDREALRGGGGRAARALRRRRHAARARQRRLGDRRDGRRGRLPRRAAGLARRAAALDLTEDPAILTAVANDVGVEAIFPRQVIAYGRPGDVAARALDERRLGQRRSRRSPRRGGAGS